MERMRRQGYCIPAIDSAMSIDSVADRVAWIKEHLTHGCEDCSNANYFKNMEYQVALLLDAEGRFDAGQMLDDLPGYREAMSTVMMTHAMRPGWIKRVAWLTSMIERRNLKSP